MAYAVVAAAAASSYTEKRYCRLTKRRNLYQKQTYWNLSASKYKCVKFQWSGTVKLFIKEAR